MSKRIPSPVNAQSAEQEQVFLLHDFFARSVRLWAHRTAVDLPPGNGRPDRCLLTYAELERHADVIAGALGKFVNRECVVAILLPRGTAQVYSSQLAVLKTGAAFTCLDPSFPEERIREIIEDSEAVALLTDSQGRERCCKAGYPEDRVLDVAEWIENTRGPIEPLPRPGWLTGESLAYIIYTSGSTGRPKGVMIEHRGIANLVASDLAEFRLSPEARVGQSSSSAYDSSIEETWLALAAGATLVVMDDDAARLGPDLVAWLHRERITVFCPPPTLLRTTDCEDPKTALPHLSLLYVGGEALPCDLADSWSKGRQLVNGYGPTECTVTALRGAVREGGPITIGRPIAGMHAWVLDEELQEVAEGRWGELCLGGIGLARGYWKRSEITAERFISHPRFGRLYRTGDIVHRESDGSYFYHGRHDSQVKIRGYRLELEDVEARLAKCPGVRSAVCAVQGDGGQPLLVAFIVPENPEAPPPFDDLKAALRVTSPTYMVPARFGLLSEMPTTVGGKIDRKALPHLGGEERRPNRNVTAPRDPLEVRMEEAFREILGLRDSISIHDDFFADLGGDSLRAAQLVSLLRRNQGLQWITVRDLYERRTVAELARQMRTVRPEPAAAREERRRPAGKTLIATAVQASWLLATYSLVASLAYLLVFEGMPWLTQALGLIPSILMSPLIISGALALYTPLAVLTAVAVKRCLIGRYRPLRAPVWGGFYLRNWVVMQVVRSIPWRLLSGTAFQQAALRALGARIGRRVHIHRGVNLLQGGWDLLEIGDQVTIGQDAALRLVELDDGYIVVGPVSLGDGATLDTRAGVACNTRLEPGAYLSPLSSLPPGGMIPKNERWDGIPARPAGQAPPTPEVAESHKILPPLQHGLLLILARFGIGWLPLLALQLLAVSAVAWYGLEAGRFLDWLFDSGFEWVALLCGIIAIAPAMAISLGLKALVVRMLGRIPEGVISVWSLTHIRVWLKTGMVQSAGEWLSGTLFWPTWLRASGMKMGGGCEISTIIDVVPELVEIGHESFFADGVYLGGPRLHRGTVTLAATRISKNTFLGNHAVIPAGQQLAENILLGICTVGDDTKVRAGSSWFGHPPFELPKREVVACERRFTYEPSWIRYLNRWSWELLRFVLPAVPLLIGLIWIKALAASETAVTRSTFLIAVVPLLSLAAAALPCFLVLGLKWGMLGRVRPGRHPLWSCWCSRWDFLYVAWGFWARPYLSALEGTLLLGWYLRAMGMKLGKRVVLGSGFAQVVDPDMIHIADEATVHAMFQAHTFEDRVLKIDRIHIRSRATLGAASVPLYGADIGAGTHVAPHSVVMKQELLLPGFRYEGSPTRAVSITGVTGQGSEKIPDRQVSRSTADIPKAAIYARQPALDAARGLAVLGMIYMHFMPHERTEGLPATWLAHLTLLLEGKPAALFCVLAGMAWSIQASRAAGSDRFPRYIGRRALALAGAGLLFAVYVWPTEILMPLALMMVLSMMLMRCGKRAPLLIAVALIAAVPLVQAQFGHYSDIDWSEDGSHAGLDAIGWATLRYFLIDGDYPLFPWLAFPLFGMVLMTMDWTGRRAKAWFWRLAAIGLILQGYAGWAESNLDALDGLAAHLTSTWVPTSVPFMLVSGAWATAAIVGLMWWPRSGGLARTMRPVILLGRASLTHYLLHICLVYAPLRTFFPDEDWSAGVGAAAFLGYAGFALPLTILWFRRFRRGPFEELWAIASGKVRRPEEHGRQSPQWEKSLHG